MKFDNQVIKQIKLDASDIKFSKADIRKGLKFPDTLSEDLAYLCGVLSGDGCISINNKKQDYAILLVGNPKDEIEFYDSIIVPIFKKLFGIQIYPRITDHKTAYMTPIHSKALVEFFIKIFDFPIGKKYAKLKIPSIIKSDQKFVISFIRGLADTDFCISLKRRNKQHGHYPVINCVSKSRTLIEELSKELAKLGFKELVGHKKLLKWMDRIGFKSPKNIAKFKIWADRNPKHAKIII